MYPIFDLHADTLEYLYLLRGAAGAAEADLDVLPDTMVDLTRMEQGGYLAQFFPMFLPYQSHPELTPMPDMEYYHLLRDSLLRSIERHSDRLALARNAEELRRNRAAGKISAILTIEDGCALR